jgi:hypothetical protein
LRLWSGGVIQGSSRLEARGRRRRCCATVLCVEIFGPAPWDVTQDQNFAAELYDLAGRRASLARAEASPSESRGLGLQQSWRSTLSRHEVNMRLAGDRLPTLCVSEPFPVGAVERRFVIHLKHP